MKNIDFLPTAYRERNALRDARGWWGVVVMVFGTVILATASVQFTWRRSVERQLAAVEPQYLAATARDTELARLQKQIQAAGEAAGLYTYLQHPWPRTQILAAIVTPLPDSIQLHEVHLTEEVLLVENKESGKPKRRSTKGEEDKKLPPAEQDLADLRKEFDARQTVVEVAGVSDDIQQLHQYVAEVGKSPLVASAQLKSLEAIQPIGSGNEPRPGNTVKLGGTRFAVHLVIKQGYGQPGGPRPADPAPATAGQAAAREPLAGGPR